MVKPTRKRTLFVSFFIACISCIILFATFRDYGIVWDEPIYFANGLKTWSWIMHPRLVNKDAFFRPVEGFDIHPPLRKLVSGMTHEIFTTYLHSTDTTTSYRVSSLIFVFPLMFVFAAIAISWFGIGIGILVSSMFFFLPSVFFLAHLVTLDYAIMALWFLAIFAFYKSKTHPKWAVVSAVCIAFSLLTKFHGVILYLPIVATWVYLFGSNVLGKDQKEKKKAWGILGIILIVSLAIYILCWPWLWTSPVSKFTEYLQMQFGHGGVPVYILGKQYTHAPWFYAPVMVLVTTPLIVLLTAGVGMYVAVGSKKILPRFVFFHALFLLVFFSLPGVPRYDGVRLFLALFPFLCLLSGFGIQAIISSFGKPIVRRSLLILFYILWGVTLIHSIVFSHPYESSYYNELIGGVDGAAKKGMEVEYWGSSYLSVLPFMNGNKTHMQCVFPTTDPFYYYQAMGQIAPGVVFNAGEGACEYYVVLMRQGLFYRNPGLEKLVATSKPIYSVLYGSTPLINVYKIK